MTHALNISWSILIILLCLACETATEQRENPLAEQEMNPSIKPPQKDLRKRIIFFGNSLTAAYGIAPSEGFVALIQEKIDAKNLPYKTINAGISGETTAGGKARIPWILKQPVDVFVLELGLNDLFQGVAPKTSKTNLESIIRQVQESKPGVKIILAGMEAPIQQDKGLGRAFNVIYPNLASTHDVVLIPSFLAEVGNISSLNLPDGIHPNSEGHRIIAETVWKHLEPLLKT